MGSVKLWEYEWSDNPREVEYYLPDSWDVKVHNIAGAHRPELNDLQIEAAIASPIGTNRIRDLAKGKRKVCILFDDMSPGTPTWRIAPVSRLRPSGE